MYVYILSEDWREKGERHMLFTVGFYKPDGKFETDSDHSDKDAAAARVHYLNGGMGNTASHAIERLCDAVYEYGIGVRVDR